MWLLTDLAVSFWFMSRACLSSAHPFPDLSMPLSAQPDAQAGLATSNLCQCPMVTDRPQTTSSIHVFKLYNTKQRTLSGAWCMRLSHTKIEKRIFFLLYLTAALRMLPFALCCGILIQQTRMRPYMWWNIVTVCTKPFRHINIEHGPTDWGTKMTYQYRTSV